MLTTSVAMVKTIHKSWYDTELGPMLTYHNLILRGWTRADILTVLGEPDRMGVKPKGGAPIRLYAQERVLQAEANRCR
jgi:hypothetical protein